MAKKQKGKQKAPSPTSAPAPIQSNAFNTITTINEVSETAESIGNVAAPTNPSAPTAAVTTQHRRVHIQEEGDVHEDEDEEEWAEEEYDEPDEHTGWRQGLEGTVGASDSAGATAGWDEAHQSQAPAAVSWGAVQLQDHSPATTMPQSARIGWAAERETIPKVLTSAGGGAGWNQAAAAVEAWPQPKQVPTHSVAQHPPVAQAQRGWTNWGNEGKAPPQATWRGQSASAQQNTAPIQAQASWTTWAKEVNMAPPKAYSHAPVPAPGHHPYAAQQSQDLRALLSDPYQARMAAVQPQQQPYRQVQAQAAHHHTRERNGKMSKQDQAAAWGHADNGGWGTAGGGDWGIPGQDAGGAGWSSGQDDGWAAGGGGGGGSWGQTADTGWGGAEGDSGLGHNTAASWGDIDEEGEESMEDEWVEEEDEWEDSRKVRFADDNPARAAARAASKTPVTQSAPASRTMAMATGGEAIPGIARVAAPPENGDSSIHVVETSGAAMSPAQTALFGRDRAAKNRIYWGLSPHQNKRVSSLLAWVIAMEDKIAELGLHKFLTTRERGALFSNAEYTPASSYDMAFDWLTFPYLQFTRDKTLQESVLFYKPAEEVVVFVFLLSPSRNSMAVWRKKIAIPDDLRIRYSKEIQSATRSLRADYGPLHVDELPASPTATEPLPDQPKRRRFFGRSESSKKLQRADAEERRREVVEQKKVTLVDHGPVPMIVDGREPKPQKKRGFFARLFGRK